MEKMKNGLCQPDKKVIEVSSLTSINLVGDPGCDGLGAGIMTTFAKSLESPETDLTLIVGDMVPHGSKQIYRNVIDFISSASSHPVFCLKGNHDTDFYQEFFGSPDYALFSPEILLVVLDNAARRFTPEALSFCRETLESYGDRAGHILFAFHYPPPNPIATNSINPPEWKEFQEIYSPYKEKINYFIAGHVHTLAITECDGIPALVTGGGGARIEPINPGEDNSERHHRIRLYLDEKDKLCHEILFLDETDYTREEEDEKLTEMLEKALSNEISAHFRYGLLAFRAAEEGRPETAAMFKALADSEFFHAANHYEVLNRAKPLAEEIGLSIDGEAFEVNTMYPEYAAYAGEKGHSLAGYTFTDALNAEKVHRGMLERARDELKENRDIPGKAYYTCTSCGYTFEFDPHGAPPRRCPVCGAPEDKIIPSR